MAESKNDENHKLQYTINKFDPELKLNEIKKLSYSTLLNWIDPIQKQIDQFKDEWKSKIAIQFTDSSIKRFYKTSYSNSESIIKCFDEEIYHLNNDTGMARLTRPGDEKRGIYLYAMPFNEYISYQTAEALKWQFPQTSLAIITSDLFHNTLGRQTNEKICSLQTKIADAADPLHYIINFFKGKKEKPVKEILEELNTSIDQQAFEEAFLLSWLTGEANGSPSKYILVPKNGKMAFVKCNSLTCFSSNYFETDSFLIAFSHLNQNLSKINQEKLKDFEERPIIELMRFFGKNQGAISCFQDRVRRMKNLASEKDVLLRSFVPIGWRKDHWKLESFLLKLYHEGIAFT